MTHAIMQKQWGEAVLADYTDFGQAFHGMHAFHHVTHFCPRCVSEGEIFVHAAFR